MELHDEQVSPAAADLLGEGWGEFDEELAMFGGLQDGCELRLLATCRGAGRRVCASEGSDAWVGLGFLAWGDEVGLRGIHKEVEGLAQAIVSNDKVSRQVGAGGGEEK
jgi:hypothetical protein